APLGGARGVGAPRHWPRAGVLPGVPEPLPPLFTRVQLSLENPAGAMTKAEVVRQVPEGQARGWGFPPGGALQFLEPPEQFREAVSRRMRGLAPIKTPAGSERPDLEAERVLARHRTAPADPYARVGLPKDAEFDEIRIRWRELRAELETVLQRNLAVSQREEAQRLLGKLNESLERI